LESSKAGIKMVFRIFCLPRQKDWELPYRKLAKEVGIDPELRVGYAQAAELLAPILAGHLMGKCDPRTASWK
jgi:hypothetical protein